MLTAVAAGHVTITAGTASADVTVSSVALAPGSVLWSNAIGGGAARWILPAVPSAFGIADVFALSGKTVYAITSDGATAWTADLSDFRSIGLYPDFQGGLVVVEEGVPVAAPKVVRLDGLTGRRYPAYTPDPSCAVIHPAVHPDGTIFAVQTWCEQTDSVIGIDPISGTLKFHVPLPSRFSNPPGAFNLIIAGDGAADVPYDEGWWSSNPKPEPNYRYGQLGVLRVTSTGESNDFIIRDWFRTAYYEENIDCQYGCYRFQPVITTPTIITNADTGAMLSWYEWTGVEWKLSMANITSSGVSTADGPQVPHYSRNPWVSLDVQAQDGSFIGETADDTGTLYTFSFDVSGNTRWVVPNVWPAMATADGGFIGGDVSGSNQYFTFDQYGNATGQLAGLPVQSWSDNWYRIGSIEQVMGPWYFLGASFWAYQGGQYTSATAGLPIDSVSNDAVRTPGPESSTPRCRPGPCAKSHCAAVFADPGRGLASNVANYSLVTAQKKLSMTNVYDVSKPEVARWTRRAVTAGRDPSLQTLREAACSCHGSDYQYGLSEPNRRSSEGRPPHPTVSTEHEVHSHA